MTETYEINGTFPTIEDVKVKFIRTVQVEDPEYSEAEVLRTIASLEQRKIDIVIPIDEEIAKNYEMLAKIRVIDRTNNVE